MWGIYYIHLHYKNDWFGGLEFALVCMREQKLTTFSYTSVVPGFALLVPVFLLLYSFL